MYEEDTVVDALAVVVKEIDGYDGNNVTLGDPAVLDGGHDKCVIINTGAINPEDNDDQPFFMKNIEYLPTVEIYYRYVYDAETRENLRIESKSIMQRIDGHPTLSGVASMCKCSGAGELEYIGSISGAGPHFIRRVIRVSVRRIEAITLYE